VESDLNPRNGQPQADFLKTREAWAHASVTNPPYKHAAEWIRHAYDLRLGYLALLLKADFLNAEQRRKLVEQVGYPTRIWVLTERPDFRNQGAPTMNCSWFVWDRWHAPRSILQMPAGHGALQRDLFG
jgi:hypothetical protein